MNLPTITDIKIKNSSGNKNSNTILVSTREFDPNTHRIILRVNNKFYDDLKYHIKEVVINQGGSQFQFPGMNESVTIYAQLYDYKNDRIICTKKKDFTKILGSWGSALWDSIMSAQNDYFNLFWNKNKRIVKVNGPFDKDGKLQAEVKPGERYYFTAQPNQKLHDVELLSAKWEYQYDDGNPVLFKNHHETIKNSHSAMDCEFHADPKKIKVFAYFKERNENVMVEFGNFGKTEEAIPKDLQVEEKSKESAQEEKPEVENNEESLIWSKKVSPEFCNKVISICKNLWGEKRKMEMANGLMAVMNVETWGSFKAHHREGYKSANDDPKKLTIKDFWKNNERKSTRAVGLIQFTQDALQNNLKEFVSNPQLIEEERFDELNKLKLKYAQMGELKQLDKVQKYFNAMKNSIKTPEDIYLAVFAPKGIGKKDNFVLYEKGTQEYTSNESVDIKNIPTKNGKVGDGSITRKEILKRYHESYEEGTLNIVRVSDIQNNDSRKKQSGELFKEKDQISQKNVVTYHIYSTGNIEKHIPKNIKKEFEKKYKYIYHKNNKEYTLGIFNIKYTKTINKGNIVGKSLIELIDVREFKGYSSNELKLKFLTLNTESERFFINPDCYAGLLGAMASLEINYLGFNGFSNFQGKSTGGSSSHRNGEKGDLRYLSKKRKGEPTILQDSHFDVINQNKFNDALYKFGWGKLEKMYSEYFNYDKQKNYLLNHTKHMRKDGPRGYRHYHHLHLTGYDHSIIKIIKES